MSSIGTKRRVVTVVGARPQFIKAANISRELRRLGIDEDLIHTGQHYDYMMSGAFFEELELAPPAHNLEVGSGSHGVQTAQMLVGLEREISTRAPSLVLVYGDTNSTLAGALAAAKLGVPIAHVEAGLRSGNRSMPEEINRIVTDHLASIHFCPGQSAVENLLREGISRAVFDVGDPMVEPLRAVLNSPGAEQTLQRVGVERRGYALITIHRAENTDDAERLAEVLESISALGVPMLFPVHPRTKSKLTPSLLAHIASRPHFRLVEPLRYAESIRLIANARLVITDSGGIQKEAYWCGTPCVTVRPETEWPETLVSGWNMLMPNPTTALLAHSFQSPIPSSGPVLYVQSRPASELVAQVVSRLVS